MNKSPDANNKLNRLFCYYVLSGLFFSIALSAVIISERYENSLSDILKRLESGKQNLPAMQNALADMDTALSDIKRMTPPDISSQTGEMQILIRLDELKSRMNEAEITVSSMEYRGDEINLPVVIKAPMKDYASLVNAAGYLQAQSFPVFNISNLSLSQAQDKSVLYEIRGTFRALKVNK